MVAETIYNQLGGNRFAVMTGVKNYIMMSDGLRFYLGRNKSKANMVEVKLAADDTYTMRFIKRGKMPNTYAIMVRYADKGLSEEEYNSKVAEAIGMAMEKAKDITLKECEGIYAENLRTVFTEYTGLYTSL